MGVQYRHLSTVRRSCHVHVMYSISHDRHVQDRVYIGHRFEAYVPCGTGLWLINSINGVSMEYIQVNRGRTDYLLWGSIQISICHIRKYILDAFFTV